MESLSRYLGHLSIWLFCVVFLVGCAAAGDQVGNLGVLGATCQSSPECSPPLQCIDGLCTEIASEDAASSEPGDGSSVDAMAMPGDSLGAEDGSDAMEIALEISESADILSSADTNPTNIFSDCEEMGISDLWAGTFMGIINFTVDPPIPGLLDEGSLIVSGDLSFEIKCLDQKLVVAGQMDGMGEAVGEEGQHPYTSKLAGYYNPQNGKIEAELIDGIVNIVWAENRLIKVDVYYAGTLEGVLQPSGDFEGEWFGEETGNQLGANVEAAGTGTWEASPIE